MFVNLTAKEVEELSRFRFSSNAPKDGTAEKISDVLIDGNMGPFLKKVKHEIQAPDLRVAASVFMKRFAFVAVIYLYAMSVWKKRLQFSLETLHLLNSKDEAHWLPEYYFEKLEALPFENVDFDAWRNESLQHLFKDVVFPVLDSLAKEGKVSRRILWENIAVYIYWLYENVLGITEGSHAAADFDYICNKAPGYLFGSYNSNPLQRFNQEPIYLGDLGEFVKVRKTCCFTYQLGEKRTYCKTCPLYCRQFNAGKSNRRK